MVATPPADNVICHYSTVVNLTNGARSFGFLGFHGKRLDQGEAFSQFGDLREAIAGNERERRSFENALANGDLGLIRTPAPHLYDDTNDETKMLTVAGGSFVVADPCWGALSVSSLVDSQV